MSYAPPHFLGLEVGTLAQWTAGLATFSAVIVALFGDWLRSKLFRPKLELSLVSSAGEEAIAQFNVPIVDGMPHEDFLRAQRSHFGVPCRFFHVRVANKRKWPPAREVRLYLVRLTEFDGDGVAIKRWEGDLPLTAKNEDLFPARKVVGPPIEFDVVSVDCEGFMHTHTAFASFSMPQHSRAPVHRHLHVVARCDELESNPLRLSVKWDGAWFQNWAELSKHLMVDTLPDDA